MKNTLAYCGTELITTPINAERRKVEIHDNLLVT
jgi:hypothetical protein